MCGRFTQERPNAELAALFAAELRVDDADGRFNIAPTQQASVVLIDPDEGGRVLTALRWGLVPSWAKDARIGSRLINARAETVAATPAFRASFRRRRCLVPADGFYEWQRLPGSRQPYAIRPADGTPLAFAGLWSPWRDPALPDRPEPLRTFTIVTTTPNDLMAALHNRMPVVLPPAAWDRWLDPTLEDPAELQGLLVPCPSERLLAYPIAPLVNSVRNQGPALIVPLEG